MEATPRRRGSRFLLSYLASLVLAVSLFFWTGCLPYPHTSEEFPAVQGRIVDAATLQPVAGARVAFEEHPETFTTSDASGSFQFPRVTHFYLGVTIGMCSGDWPDNDDMWSPFFDITHPDYEPFNGLVEADPSAPPDASVSRLQEVRLTRKQP